MKLYVASYIILRSLYIRPRAVLYHTPWIYITRVGEFSVYIAQGGKGYTFYESAYYTLVTKLYEMFLQNMRTHHMENGQDW